MSACGGLPYPQRGCARTSYSNTVFTRGDSAGSPARARPALRPLGHLEPVTASQRFRHLRLRVLGIEDVVLEVAADPDRVKRHVGEMNECVGGKVSLRHGVVL